MKKIIFLISFLLLLFISSCNDAYKFTLEVTKKSILNSSINISLKEENEKPIDSIQFFINGEKISSKGNSVKIKTNKVGLGKHVVSALVFFDKKTKKKNNSFEVLATNPPEVWSFEIVNSYPHDTKAYTQGLEYYNGFLYETTGRKGQSTLRKVDIKTGKVLKKIDLDKKYFGEGMTIFNNKIYWLTWQGKKGFVYSLDTFKLEKEFNYGKSAEGWGLTHNESELIKSDGTHKVWFLDPNSLNEKSHIQVYTNKYAVGDLNELEWINGKLYANKYQQNAIVIINPETGAVEAIANLKSLKTEMEKSQKLVAQDEVLNGIAYDEENNRLFVTGKNWGKLFEIKFKKQQ